MFKTTYKAANDDITPDSALLDKTLAAIDRADKKPVVFPIKTLGTWAAVLAVTVTSVYGYIRYDNATSIDIAPEIVRMNTNIDSGNNTTTVETNSEASSEVISGLQTKQSVADTSNTSASEKAIHNEQPIKKSYIPAEDKATVQKTTPQTQLAPSPSANEADASVIVRSASSETEANSDKSADNNTIQREISPIQTTASVAETDSVDSADKTLIQAETSPAQATLSEEQHPNTIQIMSEDVVTADSVPKSRNLPSDNQIAQITYEEYCVYIGSDIFETADMPLDVLPHKWATSDFDTDNDEVTLSFYGENGREAHITPTRNTEKIYDNIQKSTSTNKSDDYSAQYSNDVSVAHIVSGDVGYIISCTGFDEKEFSALTESVINH